MSNTTNDLGLPECPCFQDEKIIEFSMVCAAMVAAKTKREFSRLMEKSNLCAESKPYVLDDLVISVLVDIAIGGTIIEAGSEDAERETIRVLEGMESRLAYKIKVLYEKTRHLQREGKLPRLNGRGEEIAS